MIDNFSKLSLNFVMILTLLIDTPSNNRAQTILQHAHVQNSNTYMYYTCTLHVHVLYMHFTCTCIIHVLYMYMYNTCTCTVPMVEYIHVYMYMIIQLHYM